MLSLLLAIACSTGNALSMKLAEGKTSNSVMLLLVNYVVAFFFGLVFMAGDGSIPAIAGADAGCLGPIVAMALINGFLYVATFVLLQINVARNGATVSASLSHMGILIPIVLSVVVFREYPAGLQVVGVVVALAAIMLFSIPPSGGRGSESGASNAAPCKASAAASVRWLLIPMLVSSGLADMMSKFFAAYGVVALESLFMQITFTVALLLCMLLAFRAKERLNRADVVFGIALGVCNYLSVKLLIGALYYLPSFFVYASYGIGVVLLTNLVNMVGLHEKLTTRDCIGMIVIVLAILLLNL